jgi:hypothetical protein
MRLELVSRPLYERAIAPQRPFTSSRRIVVYELYLLIREIFVPGYELYSAIWRISSSICARRRAGYRRWSPGYELYNSIGGIFRSGCELHRQIRTFSRQICDLYSLFYELSIALLRIHAPLYELNIMIGAITRRLCGIHSAIRGFARLIRRGLDAVFRRLVAMDDFGVARVEPVELVMPAQLLGGLAGA